LRILEEAIFYHIEEKQYQLVKVIIVPEAKKGFNLGRRPICKNHSVDLSTPNHVLYVKLYISQDGTEMPCNEYNKILFQY